MSTTSENPLGAHEAAESMKRNKRKLTKFPEEEDEELYSGEDEEEDMDDLDDLEDEEEDEESPSLINKISSSKVQQVKQPKKKRAPSKLNAEARSGMLKSIHGILNKTRPLKKKSVNIDSLSQEEKIRKQLYTTIARLQSLAPEKCKVNISC
jgi:hypothetical protein